MKILAVLPLVYRSDVNYCERDVGLVARGLRELGHAATLFLLEANDKESRPGTSDIVTAPLEDWEDPNFWQAFEADAVIFNGWSATRFDGVRQAILRAVPNMIEKLDTTGVKSPHIYFWHQFRRGRVHWTRSDQELINLFRSTKALVKSAIKTIAFWKFPQVLYPKMVSQMSTVPVFAAETPLACARVERFLRIFKSNPTPKVIQLPHPANDKVLTYDSTIQKKPLIIAVGRWNDSVKGGILLLKAADSFLDNHLEWELRVVGGGAQTLESVWRKTRNRERIYFMGRKSHEELRLLYNQAKILAITSHSETFNIAGAEALCCGCSVVGPTQIPSSLWFASKSSGTPCHVRNPIHFADALAAEATEWETQKRDPNLIAKSWKAELGMLATAKKYLKAFSREDSTTL